MRKYSENEKLKQDHVKRWYREYITNIAHYLKIKISWSTLMKSYHDLQEAQSRWNDINLQKAIAAKKCDMQKQTN
jgi:hypothetical protein